MSRYRQPVPPAQAVALVCIVLTLAVARTWIGYVTPEQWLLVLLVLEFVIQPLSTLVHEVGHAVAARSQGAESVSIMIGRGPWIRFSLGGVRVNFSVLPTRGVMIRGLCRYDTRTLSWRGRAVVALAGPVATLAELIVLAVLATATWAGAGAVLRNLIAYTLLGLVLSLIANLVPNNKLSNRGAAVMPNDGAQALRALKLHRDGEPLPGAGNEVARPDAPRTPAEPDRQPAYLGRTAEAARAATSIPPPASSD